jgi:hypothetical protein
LSKIRLNPHVFRLFDMTDSCPYPEIPAVSATNRDFANNWWGVLGLDE